VSSLGVVSWITSCCPAGRSGTATSIGENTSFCAVPFWGEVHPVKHINAKPATKVDSFLIMVFSDKVLLD
jgi:hypothetical protein